MTEQTTPEILSEEALKEIEARANAATEGPWTAKARNWAIGDMGQYEPCADIYAVFGVVDKPRAIGMFQELVLNDVPQANGEFAAHAREDIPALIQTVRALKQLVEIQSRESEGDLTTIGKVLAENAALRDQLAQAQRCHADAEEDLASARLRIDELESLTLESVQKEPEGKNDDL